MAPHMILPMGPFSQKCPYYFNFFLFASLQPKLSHLSWISLLFCLLTTFHQSLNLCDISSFSLTIPTSVWRFFDRWTRQIWFRKLDLFWGWLVWRWGWWKGWERWGGAWWERGWVDSAGWEVGGEAWGLGVISLNLLAFNFRFSFSLM